MPLEVIVTEGKLTTETVKVVAAGAAVTAVVAVTAFACTIVNAVIVV
jgi:hypothetical protein